MPLPRKPYRDWTADDLAELLVDPKAEETARVDFKADCELLSDVSNVRDKARQDLLKDVAVMANGVGGALLMGVDELRDSDTPPVADSIPGLPQDKAESLKQAIKGLVDTHLDVRPASLLLTAVEAPNETDKRVLIVEVPQNTYSLSMVTYNQLNQFWVRRHTDNRLMTTDEIQYELEKMTKVRDSARDELDQIRENLENDKPAWPIVWFAAVPVARSRDHVPVVSDILSELIKNSSYNEAFPTRSKDLHLTTPFWFFHDCRPSLRGFGLREQAKKNGRFEMRRDGTIVFGAKLNAAGEVVPVEGIYEIWYSGLHLLRDIQRRFSLSELAVTQTGLIGCAGCIITRDYGFNEGEIPDHRVPMDAIMTSEGWQPRAIFEVWAEQFANYLGQEHALTKPPWVPVGR